MTSETVGIVRLDPFRNCPSEFGPINFGFVMVDHNDQVNPLRASSGLPWFARAFEKATNREYLHYRRNVFVFVRVDRDGLPVSRHMETPIVSLGDVGQRDKQRVNVVPFEVVGNRVPED